MGPYTGEAWLRITLSNEPVSDDFPWAGSANVVGGALHGGETEDYPVVIQTANASSCETGFTDMGDAPEDIDAYLGVIGHFPTCLSAGAQGAQNFNCQTNSTPPGPTGYVINETTAAGQHYWLGCPSPPGQGIDADGDGKVNLTGAGNASACAASVTADCTENSFGLTFGQDECYGDDDAGLAAPPTLTACSLASVTYNAYSCAAAAIGVYLNILVDMNHDGDWNDNIYCMLPGGCADEWAVKNSLITLQPGCNTLPSPSFRVGPNAGQGWMRITVSDLPVNDDFPWAGSATMAGGILQGGETEDYPVVLQPSIVGIGDALRPDRLSLAPPAPNPARDEIVVRFALPQDEQITLVAYDLAGRKLAELERGRFPAGEHQVTWNFRDAAGRELGAGYYVLKLRAGDRVLTRRGIRVR